MLDGQRSLLPVTACENERDVQLHKAVGDWKAVSIAKIDVQNREIGFAVYEIVQSALGRCLGRDMLCTETPEYIFAVERNDEAILHK